MSFTRCVIIMVFCICRLIVFAQPLALSNRPMNQSALSLDSKRMRLSQTGLSRAVTLPLLFVGVGLYAMTDNEWLDRYEVKEERDEVMPHFHSHVDNYLQYAPIAAVYGFNMVGIKGKNDFVNRTALLVKSEIIVGVLTYSLKKMTAVPRPDNGSLTSMPSGHTAQAFAAATFMAREYGGRSIWYSIGAYTVAAGVGTMRVLNNRHWVSDVFVGAGVGILSTNIAYLTHRYKWGKDNRISGTTMVIPAFDRRAYGLTVVHRFS